MKLVLRAPASPLLVVFGAASLRADADHHADPNEYAEEFQGYVEGASYLEAASARPAAGTRRSTSTARQSSGQLRREIRKRLRAGETTDQIEASFVARYGERILAVPPGNPLQGVATALALGVLFAGGSRAFSLVRWRNRSGGPPGGDAAEPPPAPRTRAATNGTSGSIRELEKLDR